VEPPHDLVRTSGGRWLDGRADAPAGDLRDLSQGQAPASVESRAQTIAFTSTPPSGEDWFTSQNKTFPQYVASATASSGLPVEYSIAPASADVCWIRTTFHDDPTWGSGAWVNLSGAGTCTVQADQSGNDDYLPAPRATQSFQLEKVQTWISKVKARKGTPGKTPATFSATLKTWAATSSFTIGIEPFLGQVITFSVAGRPVCSATTAAYGVATCQAVLPRSDLLRLRFTATYAGTDDYRSVSGSAFFL